MKYIKLVIEVAEVYQESLIAELFDMDFDGFEQREGQLITYITKENFGIGDRERIDQLLMAYPGEGYIESEEVVADQNWNEQWEQTIRAQTIGRFFVKPTWSKEAVPKNKILLEIDPKMSFGTGYHETTRLMLQLLPGIIQSGDTVVDAGTGTGILSIAAIKLGASYSFAFDIDEWSITNTRENLLLNEVNDSVRVEKGSSEVIPADTNADIILANIQKSIILNMMEDLSAALKEGGDLMLSGLLQSDQDAVVDKLGDAFEIREVRGENEWIAIHAQKGADESSH